MTPAERSRFLTAFDERCAARDQQGAREYGDRSFTSTSLLQLVDEISDELIDTSNWSRILWVRLQAVREAIVRLPRPRQSVWAQRSQALQAAGTQIWSYLFQEPMPENVLLKWCPYLANNAGQATVGAIHNGGVVELDWSYLRGAPHPLAALVHEFGHVRGFRRHDRRFRATVNQWLRKLQLPEEG